MTPSIDFTILGIDPGNNLGLCIIKTDSNTMEIKSIYPYTHYLDREAGTDVEDYFLKRKLYVRNIITKLYHRHNINMIGIELAFVNNRFPRSAITLSEYISFIELSVYNLSSRIKIFKYPPKSVKQLIGATGNSDKDGMLNTIKKIEEIQPFINYDMLTEHSVDALAIAYITLQKIRNNNLLCI